jgi:hypothetical protein
MAGLKLFGFEIKRTESEDNKQHLPSFVERESEDSFSTIAGTPGGAYGVYVDLEGNAKNESELIIKYRDMALTPEIDLAIEDITNEAIVYNEDDHILRIVLDDVPVPDNIKEIIEQEFEYIKDLLNFNKNAYQIFRRWYVDGRIYFHAVIDEKMPEAGIQDLRWIDPVKLRKLRELLKYNNDSEALKAQNAHTPSFKDYYMYSARGFNNGGIKGVRIAKDSIVYATSGLKEKTEQMVISYLHKAIKPLNQLRYMEDATIIYRISRAPERRIFYIDVGNLPKPKAEQYVSDIMKRQKNRLVYDQTTGEIRDDRRFMTMLEDYYLPRRDGSRGTQIETLPAGQNLGEMRDVEYFQQKLYDALNVPHSRLDSGSVFTLGRATEITRDEVKFFKFIQKLRMRFTTLFTSALEKQLILKNIMTMDDWLTIKNKIRYRFFNDNHFQELKDIDVLSQKLAVLERLDPFVGTYFSHDYVMRNILNYDEDDIQLIQAQIAQNQDMPTQMKWQMLMSVHQAAHQAVINNDNTDK